MNTFATPGDLARAQQCFQRGDLITAGALCRQVLQVQHQNPEALQLLATVLERQGQLPLAAQVARQWIGVCPGDGAAHRFLGGVQRRLGDLAGAMDSWQRATYLPGLHGDLYYALALGWMEQGQDAAALQAVAAAQCDATVHEDALRLHITLLHGMQHFDEARQMLGDALFRLSRVGDTEQILALWLTLFPQDEVPRHRLAAQGQADIPPRAGDAYVTYLFDHYAASFDRDLARLDYQAPALIARQLAQTLPLAQGNWRVLDAGCGTGLCGPLLRPYARHLAGVDLSAAMVAKAAERGGYDHLVVAELTAYLDACRHSYELIVSADTLVYFGELREVLAGMAHALVAGGWLAFSLESKESADDSPWQLSQSGRYVHGAAYVQQALDAAGLRLVSMTPATLRMNERQPVKGLIILASSP